VLARDFWKAVTVDRADLLDRFLTVLRDRRARFCVVGGQAVNAYAEPVVSLDLDVVVAIRDLTDLEQTLRAEFTVERFPHSLNVSSAGSDLRIQIQTDPRYDAFVMRAAEHDVLGITLPVASIEDVLQGKIWAVEDPSRRASKRQKDLADIARLLERRPDLRSQVPAHVLERLI
jgi:nucleotidyltransferase AbiEii toxin of type IV toxin-antitoxin system